MIDRDEVFAALRLGYRFEEFVPALRKDVSRAAVVVPVDLATTQEEDPAQDQLSDARRKCFGVGDGQRGTPGPAEDHPLVDRKMFTQGFDVGQQLVRRVHRQVGAVGNVRGGSPAAALVE